MKVYCLEQCQSHVPAGNGWLSASEAALEGNMRFDNRRSSWRLGRWTAKRAVAACTDLSTLALEDIEIIAPPSGAPEVSVAKQPAGITISLSHRGGFALCAVAQSRVALGCDLEIIEPRSDAFIADYFTPAEQEMILRASTTQRALLPALLWSAKESVLKALGVGLRMDTRCVVVQPLESAVQDVWLPLEVCQVDRQSFHGWWRYSGTLLRTLVAAPPPTQPIYLPV